MSLSFFKEIVLNIIYSTAVLFNSYAAVYIAAGIVTAFITGICTHISSRGSHRCDQLIPYVTALQDEISDIKERDNLLDKLYSVNHFSIIPSIIANAVHLLICLIIYPSLFMISAEGHDIPVDFLWVEDVTAKGIDLFTFLLYGAASAISIFIPTVLAKKLSPEKVKMCFLSLFISLAAVAAASHIFTIMLVIYLISKSLTSTVIMVIRAKLTKPMPELIVPEDIEAVFQLHTLKNQKEEEEELAETSD